MGATRPSVHDEPWTPPDAREFYQQHEAATSTSSRRAAHRFTPRRVEPIPAAVAPSHAEQYLFQYVSKLHFRVQLLESEVRRLRDAREQSWSRETSPRGAREQSREPSTQEHLAQALLANKPRRDVEPSSL